MDRLEAMTILVTAVDTGSLTAASRYLRIPLTTVSRRVSELEEHLNVRLVQRGSRRLKLTEPGMVYVATCRRILEEVAEAERIAAGEYQTPRGELILSAPQAMGRAHVMPVVAEFLRAYPDIRMRVQLDDRRVSLLEENVDLALRVGDLADSTLIAVRAGTIRQVLCACPAYLEKRGVPKSLADLSTHDCIGYETLVAGTSWGFQSNGIPETVRIQPRLIVNSAEAAYIAATAGAGIACVLSYQIEEAVRSGRLARVLEAFELDPIPVSLIYPSQRQPPLKLRAFLDFAIPRLRARLST